MKEQLAELERLCRRLVAARVEADTAIRERGPIEGYPFAYGSLQPWIDDVAAELTKRGVVGPCWSCDAPNSPAYACERGHEWFCCEETCGQKVEPSGGVDWDHCPECQDIYDADDEQEANTDKRHF